MATIQLGRQMVAIVNLLTQNRGFLRLNAVGRKLNLLIITHERAFVPRSCGCPFCTAFALHNRWNSFGGSLKHLPHFIFAATNNGIYFSGLASFVLSQTCFSGLFYSSNFTAIPCLLGWAGCSQSIALFHLATFHLLCGHK